MTNKSRYFATTFEAFAFASGLSVASDGSIHQVEVQRCADFNGFSHVVTWTDENDSARRLQQEPHKAMTPQEYVREHKGNCCPVCHDKDFSGDFIEIQDNLAIQEMKCNNPDCEAGWNDIYELSGYELED